MITILARSDKTRRSSHLRGLTLIEVLISLGITTLTLSGLTSSYVFMMRSSIGLGNYVEMNMRSRNGLETFGRDTRAAFQVNEMTANTFDIRVLSPSGPLDVTYSFDANKGELVRTEGAISVSILKDVESMSFRYYNLLGAETSNATEAKKVQLDADMARRALYIENTNHVVSARYAMRNRLVSN